jgi:hypothetical protein
MQIVKEAWALAGGPRGDVKVGCVMGGRDFVAERQEMQEAPAIHVLVCAPCCILGLRPRKKQSGKWLDLFYFLCAVAPEGVYGGQAVGPPEEGRHAAHPTVRSAHAHP